MIIRDPLRTGKYPQCLCAAPRSLMIRPHKPAGQSANEKIFNPFPQVTTRARTFFQDSFCRSCAKPLTCRSSREVATELLSAITHPDRVAAGQRGAPPFAFTISSAHVIPVWSSSRCQANAANERSASNARTARKPGDCTTTVRCTNGANGPHGPDDRTCRRCGPM